MSALAACGDDSADSGRTTGWAPYPTEEAEGGAGAPEGGRADERDDGDDYGPAESEAERGPLVKLLDSQLGPVLFSGGDGALYLFTSDRRGRAGRPAVSRCHGECADAWPPFYAKGEPRAGPGVKPRLLGTIAREGRRQVTYAGQPLYFYVSDPKGQVLCNDVVEFGGTWYALTADGEPPD